MIVTVDCWSAIVHITQPRFIWTTYAPTSADVFQDAPHRAQALAFEQQSRNPKFSAIETPPPAPDYHAIQWQARLHVIQQQLDHIQAITGLKKELSRKKIIRHYNEQRLLPLRLIEDLSPQHYAQLIDQIPVSSPIKIHTSTARYYPYKSAAAHTLGYVQEIEPDLSQFETS